MLVVKDAAVILILVEALGLKSVLHSRGLSTAVGDEGGFAPRLNSAEDALDKDAGSLSDMFGIRMD